MVDQRRRVRGLRDAERGSQVLGGRRLRREHGTHLLAVQAVALLALVGVVQVLELLHELRLKLVISGGEAKVEDVWLVGGAMQRRRRHEGGCGHRQGVAVLDALDLGLGLQVPECFLLLEVG